MTTAPVITTDRLVLRPHVASDIDALTALMGTDRARYMGGPMDRQTAWRWLMSDNALWQTAGHGPWGIERQSDGAFVGQVSVAHPPEFPELELGWTLLDGFEGQGYATEAATAARDWAAAQGFPPLVSYIDPENARSIALAKRLGATRDDTAETPQNDPCLVFRHPLTPTLTTDRLTLRLPQLSDLPAYTRYCASDRTRLGGGPFSADEANAAWTAMIAHWADHGIGRFVITLDGAPIGHTGMATDKDIDLSWFIWDEQHEGKGYALEATSAVLNWAFAQGTTRLISSIAPSNTRSIALANRLDAQLSPPDPTATDLIYVHTPVSFSTEIPRGEPKAGGSAPQRPVVPTLTTERLTLREPRLSDLPQVQAYFASDRSHAIGGPLDADTVASNFAQGAGNWILRGAGPWYFELTATGELLGRTGLYFNDAWPEPELSWTIFDATGEGHGYATEAAAAAIDGLRALGIPSLISSITEDNAASLSVAKKLGATDEGLYDTPYGPMRKFRHYGAAA